MKVNYKDKSNSGPVTINAEDFDAKIHEKHVEPDEPAKEGKKESGGQKGNGGSKGEGAKDPQEGKGAKESDKPADEGAKQ